MDEEVLNDLYKRAVSLGYKKTKSEFSNLLRTDDEVFNDNYSYVRSQGYNKGESDFSVLIGRAAQQPAAKQQTAKQPVGKQAPGSVPGPSGGLRLPSNLTGSQIRNLVSSGKYKELASVQPAISAMTATELDNLAAQISGKSPAEAIQSFKSATVNKAFSAPISSEPQAMAPTPSVQPMAAPTGRGDQARERLLSGAQRTGNLVDEEQPGRPTYKTPEELEAELRGEAILPSSTIKPQQEIRGEFETEIKQKRQAKASDIVSGMDKQQMSDALSKAAQIAEEDDSDELDLGPYGKYPLGTDPDQIKANRERAKLFDADLTDEIANEIKRRNIIEDEQKVPEELANYFKTNEELRTALNESQSRMSQYTQQYQAALNDPSYTEEDLNQIKNKINEELSIQKIGNVVENYQWSELELYKKLPKSLYAGFLDLSLMGMGIVNSGKEALATLITLPVSFVDKGLAESMRYALKPVDVNKIMFQAEKKKLGYESLQQQGILDGLNLLNVSSTATQVIGSMGTVAVGSFAGGPAGAFIAGASLIYGDAADEARKSGFNDIEAQIYALSNAIISGALERVGFKGITKTLSTDAEKRYILSAIRSEINKGAKPDDIVKNLTARAINSFDSYIRAGLPEGLTEGAQGAQELVLQSAFNALALEEGEKGFDVPDFDQAAKMILEQFIVGKVSGGIVPGLVSAFSNPNIKYATVANEVVNGQRSVAKTIETTKALIATGKITSQDGIAFLENLKIAEAAKSSLPKYVTNKEQRKRAITLIMERNAINKDIENGDPDLVDGYNQRLVEIKSELKSIAEKKWTQPVSAVYTSSVAGFSTYMATLSEDNDKDKSARIFNTTFDTQDSGILTKVMNAMNSGRQVAAPLLEKLSADLTVFADKLDAVVDKTADVQRAIKVARDLSQKMASYSVAVESETNGKIPSLNMPAVLARIEAGVEPGDIDFMEETPEEIALAFSDILDGKDVSEQDAKDVADFLYERYNQLRELKQSLKDKLSKATNKTSVAKYEGAIGAIDEVLKTLDGDIDTAVKYQNEKALQNEALGKREPLTSKKEGARPTVKPVETKRAGRVTEDFDVATAEQVREEFEQNNALLKDTVLNAIKSITKLLNKIAPNVKVYIHLSPEDFVRTLEDEGVRQDHIDSAPTSYGKVVQGLDGKIQSLHINLRLVNDDATNGQGIKGIYHEAAHVILDRYFGADPGLISDMRKAIRRAIPSGISEKIDDFLEDGKDEYNTEDIRNEEFIAELVNILADEEASLDNNTISKIIKAINDFIERAADKLGVDPSRFLISNKRADFVDFINSTAVAVRSGLESDIKKQKQIQKRYAIQEQTAGQVPVQPGARGRQAMEEGEPEAGPQVTAEEGEGQKPTAKSSRARRSEGKIVGPIDQPGAIKSVDEKEMEIIDMMNNMTIVNEGFDIDKPMSTKEKIDVKELNSRLDTKLDTVNWSDYEGIPFGFTISDQLRTGDFINPNTGETLTDLKGGIGFNGTSGNEGNAWANTGKQEAERLKQKAVQIYNSNKKLFEKLWADGRLPDGHVPIAVVKMSEESVLSNEAMFRLGIQNVKKLPKQNRKKAIKILDAELKSKLKKESKDVESGIDPKKNTPYPENTIKAKKKFISQVQYVLDKIASNNYDDILGLLEDAFDFPLPIRVIVTKQIFYGEPTPIGGKSVDINRSRVSTPVSLALIGNEDKALINIGVMTDMLTEPSMKNVPAGHIVSIVGIDVKNPQTTKTNHPNYEYGVKGTSIGILKNPIHMKDAFGEAYSNVVSQVIKNEAANKSIKLRSALSQGIPTQSGLSNNIFKGAIAKNNIDSIDKLLGFIRQAFPSTAFFTTQEAWDSALESPSVIKKSKDGDVIYAYTADGNVYLNPDAKSGKAALHESGHVWMEFVKENNLELYEKGLSLVEGTKELEKAKEEYGDTPLAREEALMNLMSTKGNTIVNAAQKAKFKEWLITLYKFMADNFSSLLGMSPKEIENLTLEKYLDGMLADIMSGKELSMPSKKEKKGEKVKTKEDGKPKLTSKSARARKQPLNTTLETPTPKRLEVAGENLQKLFRRDGVPLTVEEAADIVRELVSWKDWYEGIATMVQDNFEEYGADYMMFMFGSAVAANSSATIGLALNNLERLYAKEEVKGVPVMKRNIYEMLSGLPITSDKISNFIAAGLGDKNAIPVDMHIWSFINSLPDTEKNPNTKKKFQRAKDFIVNVADSLGWDPREVQAAMWAANMLRLGQRPDTYEEYIQRKIDKGLQNKIKGWRKKGYRPIFEVRKTEDGRLETAFVEESDQFIEENKKNLEEVRNIISRASKKKDLETDKKLGAKSSRGKMITPSSDKWSMSLTQYQVDDALKNSGLSTKTENDQYLQETQKGNQTQRNNISTYATFVNGLVDEFGVEDLQDMSILDVGAGLGIGAKAASDAGIGDSYSTYELFPSIADGRWQKFSGTDAPTYIDFSLIEDNSQDIVVNNAVLNVIPSDNRQIVVEDIGRVLKPGGKAYISVRGIKETALQESLKAAKEGKGKNIFLSDTEYYVTGTQGDYQKGFSDTELQAYVQDILGDTYNVEISREPFWRSSSSAPKVVVTKKEQKLSAKSSRAKSALADVESTANELSVIPFSKVAGLFKKANIKKDSREDIMIFESMDRTNKYGTDFKNIYFTDGKSILDKLMSMGVQGTEITRFFELIWRDLKNSDLKGLDKDSFKQEFLDFQNKFTNPEDLTEIFDSIELSEYSFKSAQTRNFNNKAKSIREKANAALDFNEISEDTHQLALEIADGLEEGTLIDAQDLQINEKKDQFTRISEAYHTAKKDGSNPELVQAVEELIGQQEPKLSAKSSRAGSKMGYNPNYAADRGSGTDRTLQQDIYDRAAAIWDSIKDMDPLDYLTYLNDEISKTLGVDLNPVQTAELIKDLKSENRPEYRKDEDGKYRRVNTRSRYGAVMSRVLKALDELVTDKRVNRSIISGLEASLKGGPSYTVESQVDAEAIRDTIFDLFGEIKTVEIAREIYDIAMMTTGGLRSTMLARLANDTWNKARQAKSQEERDAFRKLGTMAMNQLAEEATDAGRFNSMIYRIQKLNPEFIVQLEINKIKKETDEGLKNPGKKKRRIQKVVTNINKAKDEAAQEAAKSKTVQAAVAAATNTPPATTAAPTQKSPTQKAAATPPAPTAKSQTENQAADARIRDIKKKLADRFKGLGAKSARSLPAGLDPETLDLIVELAKNYIIKGYTDRSALLAKVSADVIAAGGSNISSMYYNEMWAEVSGIASAKQNENNAAALASKIVGRVKQEVNPNPKTFDPIAEMIDALFKKATEDFNKIVKGKESRLDKLISLLENFEEAKTAWEYSKDIVEAKIDGLDPIRFNQNVKDKMKDMLDSFFRNDLSPFEIKTTPYSVSEKSVTAMLKEEMSNKKMKIEEILLNAKDKQVDTKQEFIDAIVYDIVSNTGISNLHATKIAEAFANKYDQIVTAKQESILKRYIPKHKNFETFKRKTTAQRAFEMIKYGMLDPNIAVYDSDGNLVDTAKLLAEMFNIPYIDDNLRDALNNYAETIADTPVGVLRQQVLNDMMMSIKMYEYRVQGSIGDRLMSQAYANMLTSTDSMLKAFNSNILMYNFEFMSEVVRSAAKGDFSLIPLLVRGFYKKKGVGNVDEVVAKNTLRDEDGYVINKGDKYYFVGNKYILSMANPKASALSGHYEGLLRYSMSINSAKAVLKDIVLYENFTNNVTGMVYAKHGKGFQKKWGIYNTLAQKGLGALDALTTSAATQARFSDLLYDMIKVTASNLGEKISGNQIADAVNTIQGYSSMTQLDALNQAIAEMQDENGRIDLSVSKNKVLLIARMEEIVAEGMTDRFREVIAKHPWMAALSQGEIADKLDEAREIAAKIGLMGQPPGVGGMLSYVLGIPGNTIRFSNIQFGAFTKAPVNAASLMINGNTPLATIITAIRLLKNKRGMTLGSKQLEDFYKQKNIRTEMYGEPRESIIPGVDINQEKEDLLTKFLLIQVPVATMTYMGASAIISGLAGALANMGGDDEEEERKAQEKSDNITKYGLEYLRTIPQKERELIFFGDKLAKPGSARYEGVWKNLPVYVTGNIYGYSGTGYSKMISLRDRYGIEPYTVYAYGRKLFSYKDNPILGAFAMQAGACNDALLFNESADINDSQLGLIAMSAFAQMSLIKDQSNVKSIAEIWEAIAGQKAYESVDKGLDRFKMYLERTGGGIINTIAMPAEVKNLNQDVMAILGKHMDDPKSFLEFAVYRWPVIGNIVINKDKTGPFGYPVRTQPKRVFPIGTEQFKLPLMVDGSLSIPTIDELLSTEDAKFLYLFERNKNNKYADMDITSYFEINKFGKFDKKSFTKEETDLMRDKYKLIMREFAIANMDENRPTIFNEKLKLFLDTYGRNIIKDGKKSFGYRRFILNEVFGDRAKTMILNQDDEIINLKEKAFTKQQIDEKIQDLKRLPDE